MVTVSVPDSASIGSGAPEAAEEKSFEKGQFFFITSIIYNVCFLLTLTFIYV